ncbi:RodZ domain-containing protein [Candidatus Litorirhabdus singularis]|uniref:RodZ domain-containing protein n=1 Tax=Candidatus Litorirhabdus singularis TaxID=2518993 RepID=UPI00242EA6CF|nr:RodZ domain-containing protein [Candidatus Litorirhabdus singularis]
MEDSDTKAAQSSGAPGGLLSAAREAQGISQREMADRLNWLPNYVGAIESNRFDQLRNPNFGRGYLKAYGKLVGVSEVDLIEAYEALPDVDEADKARTRRVKRAVPQVQKLGPAIPAGIMAALLLVALLWYLRGDEAEPIVVPAVTAVQEAGAEPTSPLPLGEMTEQQLASDAVIEAQGLELGSGSEPLQEQSSEPEPLSESTAVEPPIQAAAIENPAAEAPDMLSPVVVESGPLLNFSFSGACWIEIRNAAAELIYANLHDAGNTLQVGGEAPFDVLVGDARMVTLTYLGEAVPIKRRPGRVIARFTVGE